MNSVAAASTASRPGAREVYFNEFNVLMDNAAYLPLVSGLLRAYAEQSPEIVAHYRFMPFLFHRDDPARVVASYANPDVAAFSVSMWNEQLSLAVAREVKRRHPDCLVVFGGPQVPHHPADYFARYPFIDVAVRGEGEEAFSEILLRHLESADFSGIAGTAWRDGEGRCVRNDVERAQPRDLDQYPSPYLEGLFEPLWTSHPHMQFQAIIETNRGCPFLCTFCFWGQGGLSRRYRYHTMERVIAEIEWCAQHRIRYVFNADSNFGMHKRDHEIAEALVATKARYGYPEKFRTCFGKNTDDQIFEIAALLHAHDLEKGITLARQSNDAEVLKNIKRANIKMSTYRNLQLRFNAREIPVYSELILGLPGETYETWTAGIDDLLNSGLKNQLFIYFAEVYPNTELADPEYQRRFGVVTRRIVLSETHGAVRENSVPEYEDIVIETTSMTTADWRRMTTFSWVTMVMHSLKVGFFVLYYLHHRHGIGYGEFLRYLAEGGMPSGEGAILRAELATFERHLDVMLEKGEGRGCAVPAYGPIYWDEEEASFLRICDRPDAFYAELETIVRGFLSRRGIEADDDEVAEALAYQRMLIPSPEGTALRERRFEHNFPEFFETAFREDAVALARRPQILQLREPREYGGDRVAFARETVLWGRKSGRMIQRAGWIPADATLAHATPS